MKTKYFPTIKLFVLPAIIAYLAIKPSTAFTMRLSFDFCGLILIASTIEIIVKLTKTVIFKIKKKHYPLNLLLRPSISLIVALAAIYHLTAIEKEAKAYLWQLANKVQATCEAQNKCPTILDGWTKDAYGQSQRLHYVGSTEFHMRYVPYDGGKDFAIFLNYGLGEGFVVPGGMNKTIVMKATH